mmetsp:Transcript_37405/g.110442  ORF Transcript_37405/g.110442 Transcript_37405/m.110442 type:complete len:221 (+) Transcript_37405:2245-2907(+)
MLRPYGGFCAAGPKRAVRAVPDQRLCGCLSQWPCARWHPWGRPWHLLRSQRLRRVTGAGRAAQQRRRQVRRCAARCRGRVRLRDHPRVAQHAAHALLLVAYERRAAPRTGRLQQRPPLQHLLRLPEAMLRAELGLHVNVDSDAAEAVRKAAAAAAEEEEEAAAAAESLTAAEEKRAAGLGPVATAVMAAAAAAVAAGLGTVTVVARAAHPSSGLPAAFRK